MYNSSFFLLLMIFRKSYFPLMYFAGEDYRHYYEGMVLRSGSHLKGAKGVKRFLQENEINRRRSTSAINHMSVNSSSNVQETLSSSAITAASERQLRSNGAQDSAEHSAKLSDSREYSTIQKGSEEYSATQRGSAEYCTTTTTTVTKVTTEIEEEELNTNNNALLNTNNNARQRGPSRLL